MVDAVDALVNRVSSPRLAGSVPADVLHEMVLAAARAPDHAQLKPYRFLAISGAGLDALGELMVAARLESEPGLAPEAIEKLRSKPSRAPLIIVGIASPQSHPKVPEIEQLLTAGIALQNMSSLATARGYGAMWRTGDMAYHLTVHRGLGLDTHEQIVGFLYVGEIEGRLKTVQPVLPETLVSVWPKPSDRVR